MEEILNNDQWLSVVVEAQKLSRTMEDPLLREKKGFYILLAGTDTGHIITINQSTGLSDYSVQVILHYCTVIYHNHIVF